MLDFKKVFRRRKKAKRTEKQASPSSVSPSPAPSTISTSPTPPVVSNPSNDEDERLRSPSGQTDVVASANSKLAVTPVKEQSVSDKKSSKKDVGHRTRVQERTLQVLDGMTDAANIGKNASEAAQDISGPLKAAFGVTERILIMVRVCILNWVGDNGASADQMLHTGCSSQRQGLGGVYGDFGGPHRRPRPKQEAGGKKQATLAADGG
jgi:hypothetical protein